MTGSSVVPEIPAAPTKLRTFPCAACGADVVWNPGAAALTCPYCGAKKCDRFRDLAVRTAWSGLAYKNGLFPVWIAAYQHAGKPYRFLVNGVTGKTDGYAPWSWVKIGLAVAAAVLLFVILAAIAG